MAEMHKRRDRASPDDRERRHRRHRERESPQEERERPKQRSRSPQRPHRKEEREGRHGGADDSRSRRHLESEEEEEGRRRGRWNGDDERGSESDEREGRMRRRRDDGRDQNEGGGRERGEGRREEEEDRKRSGGVVREESTSSRRETQSLTVQEQRPQEKEDVSQYEYGGDKKAPQDQEKQEDPNFGLSGKLTAETNTLRGVVINYREPPEARQPKTRWRLYVFKGEEALPTLFVHRQSAYLIGRDRRIVDLPIDHPSCSKQHAVLQYRLVDYEKEDGSKGRKVKPYIIDLESTNGVYVNNQRIEAARYFELKETDMVKFGFSSREYILLHENSKGAKPEEEEDAQEQ